MRARSTRWFGSEPCRPITTHHHLWSEDHRPSRGLPSPDPFNHERFRIRAAVDVSRGRRRGMSVLTSPQTRRRRAMEPTQPLAQARSGMRVVDSSGLVQGVAEVLDRSEPDVPAPLAERLRRTGYLKVDASGLFARDLYVEASQVAGVSEEGVRLSVGRDELIEEA